MARLVAAKCPNCGAGVQVGVGQDVVQCNYCNTSSFIQRPGKKTAPPMQPPNRPPMPVIVVPHTSSAAPMIIIAIVVLVMGGGVAAGAAFWSTAAVSTDGPSSKPGSPGKSPKSEVFGPATPIKAPDLSKVDAQIVIAQAVTLAKKKNPRAKLVSAVFNDVQNGTLDLKGSSKGSMHFEFKYRDPSKPPGKDGVEGGFIVLTKDGGLETFGNIPVAGRLKHPKGGDGYPAPIPDCTSKQAWNVAVKSGVPSNAVATLHLYKKNPFKTDNAFDWSWRVADHDEHRREIDSMSCKLNRSWAKR